MKTLRRYIWWVVIPFAASLAIVLMVYSIVRPANAWIAFAIAPLAAIAVFFISVPLVALTMQRMIKRKFTTELVRSKWDGWDFGSLGLPVLIVPLWSVSTSAAILGSVLYLTITAIGLRFVKFT